MKAILVSLMLGLTGVAHAQNAQLLPEPSVYAISGAPCGKYVTPQTLAPYVQQSVVGFSADGTQVFVYSQGSIACGYMRGLRYYHWAGVFAWTLAFDAGGNLLPVATATFTPGTGTLGNTGPVYNSFGYGLQVVSTPDPYSPSYFWQQAELMTP